MVSSADSLLVEIRKQDDVRYRWTLSRRNGRVLDQGVELYVANCLVAASAGADPTSRIGIVVDDFSAGDFLAARTQLESSAVALEIAQSMLRRGI
jgi:hypothetical protein